MVKTQLQSNITMRPHHKLEVWIKAIEPVSEIYPSTERFPGDERFGLTNQIRRAAASIPVNIAEGAGRKSKRDFARFLSNSQGSASELETERTIAQKPGYLDKATFAKLIGELDRIGRLITGLSRQLLRDLGSATR